MAYYEAKVVDYSFEEAIEKVTAELKEEGFGVLTEIDVKETLKKKIDVDFRKYKILGACNPGFAHKALSIEDKVGVFLPCNVVVQENKDGKTEVFAMNPMEAMAAIDKPEMEGVASEVTKRLNKVIANL